MWYSNLECRVRLGDTYSGWFVIQAGVRQGGVLSPVFYCIYVDDLVAILCAIGVGCYLIHTFLSILLYADDMALLAPSLKGLQTLLSATENYCREWDILLNAKKTKNMVFGKSCPTGSCSQRQTYWVGPIMKQGRIHGNPVADGWAGAVQQKTLGIQKCDRRTDQWTDGPTRQGDESRVHDWKVRNTRPSSQ